MKNISDIVSQIKNQLLKYKTNQPTGADSTKLYVSSVSFTGSYSATNADNIYINLHYRTAYDPDSIACSVFCVDNLNNNGSRVPCVPGLNGDLYFRGQPEGKPDSSFENYNYNDTCIIIATQPGILEGNVISI